MPTTRVKIVTFNQNESDAVTELLDDIRNVPGSPWSGTTAPQVTIRRSAPGGNNWIVEHDHLRAQGNVLAGMKLADYFHTHRARPDYVLFYGCAGATDSAWKDKFFVVRDVVYMSLGTVESRAGVEHVVLKNKWICHVDNPQADAPLAASQLAMGRGGNGRVNVLAISGMQSARVAATDKVVKVAVDSPPTPETPGPPHDVYKNGGWSYGQALGHIVDEAKLSIPVIVDMESFGIAKAAEALGVDDRVVICRVTTDALSDHGTSGNNNNQKAQLSAGRAQLARVLLALLNPRSTP